MLTGKYQNNNSKKDFASQDGGFTLLEVLIASTIMMVVLTAAITLINRSLLSASIAKQKLTAVSLAQEGIEVVRNLRDNNWLKGKDFKKDLGQGNWRAQYNSQSLLDDSADPLKYDATSGFYSYDAAGDPSLYTRIISIDKIVAKELKITSTVNWSARGASQTVVLEDHLYDWK